MPRAWRSAPLVLVLAVASPVAADFTFPPQRHGGVEAVLEVRVAQQAAAPGLGAATYVLRFTGPAGLEVGPPRLADATGAWKPGWQSSAWSAEGGAVAMEEVVRLEQVKPGIAPLPDVKVRFRAGDAAEWQEVEWVDVLRQARDVPAPPAPPAAPAGAGWLLAVGLGLVAVVLLAGGWGLRRRRAAPAPPLPPGRRALRELEQLEGEALPGCDGGVLHVRLADAVRRYLAERFGLRALEQTTAEFLEAARPVPQLGGARLDLLREFLGRCDLAKFARAGVSPEDCRQTAALARTFVEQVEAA
jgi:hypothetical protein